MAQKFISTPIHSSKFFILFIIILLVEIIDSVIGNLSDVFSNFAVSYQGIALFISMVVIFSFSQYYILAMIKAKSKDRKVKYCIFLVLQNLVTVIQFLLILIMVIIVGQIIFTNSYHTSLLMAVSTISYGLAAGLMSVLAYWFISWFRRNNAFVVLLYGLAAAMIAVNAVDTLLIFDTTLKTKSFLRTPESEIIVEEGDITSEHVLSIVQGVTLNGYFLLLWGGTVLILYHNIQRIGRIKFWILVTSPVIFFMSFYIGFFQSVLFADIPPEDPASIILPLLVVTFSGLAATILIGLAFRSIARAVNAVAIKDYMIITAYGFILFLTATTSSIWGAGYPPFGIIDVALVGPFCFLVLTGLYKSAIAVAEDVKLRKSVRNMVRNELKFIDSIGLAQMHQNIEKKVMSALRANKDSSAEESNIQPTLTEAELKNYMISVLDELDQRRGRK